MATPNNDAPPAYSPPPPGFAPGVVNVAPPYPQPYQGYPPAGVSKDPAAYTGGAGYPCYPPAGQGTSGTTVVVQGSTQPALVTAQPVVLVRGGTCPRCLTGFIVEDFSCCGIFLAIFLFPIGLLCCLLLRTRRCNQCNYTM